MVPVKVFNSIILLQSCNEVIRVTDIVFYQTVTVHSLCHLFCHFLTSIKAFFVNSMGCFKICSNLTAPQDGRFFALGGLVKWRLYRVRGTLLTVGR